MTRPTLISFICSLALAVTSSHASVLTAIPGPDDQGGMIMPMVVLNDDTISTMYSSPAVPPLLASLGHWAPGDSFSPTSSWYEELDPLGGDNSLFNNQYGFTFMGSIPSGKALGLRLVASSSPDLQFFNYVNSQNRFDAVFSSPASQVLWNGAMWHPYAVAPDTMAGGTYTATFEVFVANASFASGTGFADYSAGALSATRDMAYNTSSITYTWTVVPEPSSAAIALVGITGLLTKRRR